jgi:hypothetical protein
MKVTENTKNIHENLCQATASERCAVQKQQVADFQKSSRDSPASQEKISVHSPPNGSLFSLIQN